MRLAEILDVLTSGPSPSLMVLATVFIFGVALPDILVKIFLLSLPSMFETVNRRKVYLQALRPGQLWTETRNAAESYFLDIFVFSAFVTLFWPHFQTGHILANIVAGTIAFEIGFYCSHRLYHTRALWWLHKHHHESHVTSPLTSTAFHVVERIWLWGIILGGFYIYSFFAPVSLAGFTFFLAANFSYNSYTHSNYETFPPALARSPLFFWVGLPYYHSMHHARVNGNYGGGIRLFDWFFGTEFPDHRQVQQRAWDGQGLQRLHERINSDHSLTSAQETFLIERVSEGSLALTATSPHATLFNEVYVYEEKAVRQWIRSEIAKLSEASASQLSLRRDDGWYYQRNDVLFGPMSFLALCELNMQGLLNEKDICFSLKSRTKVLACNLPVAVVNGAEVTPIYMNRRQPRARFHCAIHLRGRNGLFDGRTIDVGATGASIFVSAKLNAGDAFLADFVNLGPERFATDIEIINVKPYGEGYRCGIVFKNLEREAYANWISLMEKNRVFAA